MGDQQGKLGELPSCIYCGSSPEDSKDHIFPQFMGGTSTIPACTSCNNRFGSEFEATAAVDLAPFAVVLSRGGIKSKRVIIWKKAYQDESGHWYDVDTDGYGSLSRPVIAKDATGTVSAARFRTGEEVRQMLESSARTGKQYSTREEIERIEKPTARFHLELGDDLAKLATKMCLALARRFEITKRQDLEIGTRFVMGKPYSARPVYMDCRSLERLDALRKPLSHCIYVESDTDRCRYYGLVQFYGTIQMFCELGYGLVRTDAAYVGCLDPVDFREHFEKTSPLRVPIARSSITPEQYESGRNSWAQKFAREAKARTGQELVSTIEARGPHGSGG